MNEGESRVESQKSRVESQESIGWAEAHRQVYYSKLAGLITPWRLGEYPARGLLMQKNSLSLEKEQVSSKTLWTKVLTMGAVGSATMTIAIVIGGLIGLAVVGSPVDVDDNYIIILLGVLVGAIVLIAAGWKIRTVILSSYSSPSVDRRLTVGMVLKNTGQSMVRLLCWCVQLGLLLYALDGITGLTKLTGVTEITGTSSLEKLGKRAFHIGGFGIEHGLDGHRGTAADGNIAHDNLTCHLFYLHRKISGKG